MIRVCYICKHVSGEKEPFEDKSLTHGLCDRCFKKEKERLKEELDKMEEERLLKDLD
ncbi:hypothetical protein LCGC14_1607200 [marine sediment metagenome]|uniref:Uncharacterized protein n=1 Tax=marine sediment metagenome TaxID=412755 RepID=A0A0F9L9F4_9ZZZZ